MITDLETDHVQSRNVEITPLTNDGTVRISRYPDGRAVLSITDEYESSIVLEPEDRLEVASVLLEDVHGTPTGDSLAVDLIEELLDLYNASDGMLVHEFLPQVGGVVKKFRARLRALREEI